MTLVAHAAEGVFFQFALVRFAGADATRLVWLYTALWCVAAAGLVLFDRSAWRTRGLSVDPAARVAPVAGS